MRNAKSAGDKGLSVSAKENGWATYPAEYWNKTRAPKLLLFAFWQHCAKEFGGPILDLCCGNGRYAIALGQAGYDVVGVDINKGFIDRANQWAAEETAVGRPANVSFVVGDVVNLNLGRTFTLAILPGWSWQVLLSQEDQLSFLDGVRRHLAPGGAFAFNVFIPFFRQQGLVRKGDVYEWPADPNYHAGTPRTYDPATQVETMRESNAHEIKLRHTSLAEFALMFKLTGFEITEMYGDDEDMRPFAFKSGNDFTVVARRV